MKENTPSTPIQLNSQSKQHQKAIKQHQKAINGRSREPNTLFNPLMLMALGLAGIVTESEAGEQVSVDALRALEEALVRKGMTAEQAHTMVEQALTVGSEAGRQQALANLSAIIDDTVAAAGGSAEMVTKVVEAIAAEIQANPMGVDLVSTETLQSILTRTELFGAQNLDGLIAQIQSHAQSIYGELSRGEEANDTVAGSEGVADGVAAAAGGEMVAALVALGALGAAGGGGGSGSTVVADTTAPVFTSGTTATAIDENSGAGQVIYTAVATDAATVTYSLKTGGDAASFAIDGSTGAVTLTADPDYETQTSYSFTVVATDAAGNSSEQTVTLNVTDLLDEGTVVKGPISGATVIRDMADGNGDYNYQLDTGEFSTTTDETGAFTGLKGTGGIIVAIGGTHDPDGNPATENIEFTGTLTAPSNATVVTPLTTMMVASSELGLDLNAADFRTLFGLSENFDPLNYNPFAAGVDAAEALAVEKAASQIYNLMQQGVTLAENSGASNTIAFQLITQTIAEYLETNRNTELTNGLTEAAVETIADNFQSKAAGGDYNITLSDEDLNAFSTAVKEVNQSIQEKESIDDIATVIENAAAPTVVLKSDTGISTTDKITSDGAIYVAGNKADANLEYSTDGGISWNSVTGDTLVAIPQSSTIAVLLEGKTPSDTDFTFGLDVAVNAAEGTSGVTLSIPVQTMTPTATLNGVSVDPGVSISNADLDNFLLVQESAGSLPQLSIKFASLLSKIGESNELFNTFQDALLSNDGTYTLTFSSEDFAFTFGGEKITTIKLDSFAVNTTHAAYDGVAATALSSEGVQFVDYDSGVAQATNLITSVSGGTLTITGLVLDRDNLSALANSTGGDEPAINFYLNDLPIVAADGSETTLQVRQNEGDDDVSDDPTTILDFILDTAAPAAPTVVLANDTGSAADDRITNDGQITISGTETTATVEYSTDGTNWSTLTGDTLNFIPPSNTISVSLAGDTPSGTPFTFALDVPVEATDSASGLKLSVPASSEITPTATLGGAVVDPGVTITNAEVDQFVLVQESARQLPTLSLKFASLLSKIGESNEIFNTFQDALLSNDGTYTITFSSDEFGFTFGDEKVTTIELKDFSVTDTHTAYDGVAATALSSEGVQFVDYDGTTSQASTLTTSVANGTMTISGLVIDRSNLSALADGDAGTTGKEPEIHFYLDELPLVAADDAESTLLVRQTDVAGNVSETTTLNFTLETSTEGTVIKGPLSGSTVFRDMDGDYVLDDGEYSTTTDATGYYNLQGSGGTIVALGGTDTTTGDAFLGTLAAPETATVVTPLTTLLAANSELTATELSTALGLPSGVDPLSYNPFASGVDAAEALAAEKAAASIQNLILDLASTVKDNSDGAVTLAKAVEFVAQTVATQLDGQTSVDLTDTTALSTIATAVQTAANTTGVAGTVVTVSDAAVTSVVADVVTINTTIQNAADLTEVAAALGQIKVSLSNDTGTVGDKITSDGSLQITGEGDESTIQYSTNGTDWSTTAPTATEGSNTVYVREVAGETTSDAVSLTFTLDTTVPGAPVVVLATDDGTDTVDKVTSDATLAPSGETGASFEYSVDGSTGWSATAPTATEGSNTVYVRQIDVAGNTSTAVTTFAFTLDTKSTTIDISGTAIEGEAGETGYLNATEDDSDLVISGTASATSGASLEGEIVTLYIDGAAYDQTGTVDANGNYSITIAAADLQSLSAGEVQLQAAVAGQTVNSPASASFIYDKSAPTVALNQSDALADDYLNATEAASAMTITGTAGFANGQTVTVTLTDGTNSETATGTVSSGTFSVEVTPEQIANLTEGQVTVSASVSDVAGNIGTSGEASFTYDKTLPDSPTLTMASDGTITVDGIETNASWSYSVDGGDVTTGSGSSITMTEAGAHTLAVSQTDGAGNEGVAATANVVVGTTGDDRIIGTSEVELINLGGGADIVALSDQDTVAQFSLTDDKLDLSNLLGPAGYSQKYSVDPGSSDAIVRFENQSLSSSGKTVTFDIVYNDIVPEGGTSSPLEDVTFSMDFLTGNDNISAIYVSGWLPTGTGIPGEGQTEEDLHWAGISRWQGVAPEYDATTGNISLVGATKVSGTSYAAENGDILASVTFVLENAVQQFTVGLQTGGGDFEYSLRDTENNVDIAGTSTLIPETVWAVKEGGTAVTTEEGQFSPIISSSLGDLENIGDNQVWIAKSYDAVTDLTTVQVAYDTNPSIDDGVVNAEESNVDESVASEVYTMTFTGDVTALDEADILFTDSTPPSIAIIAVGKSDVVSTVNKTITGTSEPGSTVTLTSGAVTLSDAISVDAVGNWSYTLTEANLTALGTDATGLALSATAVDGAGNNAEQPAATTFDLDVSLPTNFSVAGVGDGTLTSAEATSGVLTVTLADGDLAEVTFTGQSGSVTKSASGDGVNTISLTAGDIATIGDGAVTVTTVVSDVADNVADPDSTGAFVLDTVAPSTPSINIIATDDVINAAESEASVTISGTTEADSTVTVNGQSATVDGTGWSYVLDSTAITAIGQGASTITVVATDSAGNTATATRDIMIDTLDPATPVVALSTDSGSDPNDNISNDGTITLTNIEQNATVQYSTDGGENWSTSFTAVEGDQTVQVRQTDVAGNVSDSGSLTFTLDTTVAAPTVALTSDSGTSATDGISNVGTLAISGTENGATVKYTTDGETWVSFDNFTASEGSNIVGVRQKDIAGNVSDETIARFVLDTTAPSSATITSSDIVTTPTPAITGVAEVGASVSVVVGGVTYTTTADNGSWSVDADLASAAVISGTEASYAVEVTVTDAAGNSAAASSQTLTINEDAPSISSSALSTSGTPTITGNTVVGENITVTVTVGGATYTTTTSDGGWSVNLETASPDSGTGPLNLTTDGSAANTVSVAASNAVGVTVTQQLLIDNVAPTATIELSDNTLLFGEDTDVTITFSEAVSGFTVDDLTASNATLSDLRTSDGGTTWSAVLTPAADTEAVSNTIAIADASYSDSVGNTGSAASASYAVDTVVPVLESISSSITTFTADTEGNVDVATLTFEFSEAPVGFTLSDIQNGSNGTVSDLRVDGSNATTYYATYTPDSGVASFADTITVSGSAFADAAGNSGSVTASALSLSGDTRPLDEGTAQDGYLAGSTVFRDTNDNGEWDEGEDKTTTDASGNFLLPQGPGGIVAMGGTDISTGHEYTGVLRAPEGSTVINTLTTIVAEMVDADTGGDDAATKLANAQTALKTAFGITDDTVDFTTYDPIQEAAEDTAGDTKALEIAKVMAQVNVIVDTISKSVAAAVTSSDAGAGADEAREEASASVFASLAQTIASSASSDARTDLTDTTTLKSITNTAVAETAKEVGLDTAEATEAAARVSAVSEAVADVVSASVSKVDAQTDLTGMVKATGAATGTVATKLQSSIENEIEIDATDLTSKLDTYIAEQEVGTIVPPTIDIVSMTPDGTTNVAEDGFLNITEMASDLTLEGSATGLNGQTVTIKVNGMAFDTALVTDGAFSVAVTAAKLQSLDEGTMTITVDGTDSNGVAATTAQGRLIIDTTVPTITSAESATAITENSGAGQAVYTATTSATATLTLSVTDAADFTIDGSGNVTLTADPDYETQYSYSFDVVATDVAGNSSSQTVTLDINNVDDTAPTITSAATASAIAENSGAEQVVYTAASTDDADVATGSTSYSLSGTDAGLFSIDSSSGAVTLTADPNYESKSSYSFDVVATDTAGNNSSQAVTLAITDVNEAPTEASLTTTITEIAENSDTTSTTKVADISVTDDALGTNVLTLTGTDADSFTIIGAELHLKSGVTLDYETKTSYDVTVNAEDSSVSGSSAVSENYTLTVTDVNEAPTEASLTTTITEIAENSDTASTTKVADISVTDDALGTNVLTLTGTDADSFTIIGTELHLKSGVTLDYETKTSYDVTVNAEDSSVSGSSAVSTNYTLTVTDVQETPATPTLSQSADGILFSNLVSGATWIYSTDGGETWQTGSNNDSETVINSVTSTVAVTVAGSSVGGTPFTLSMDIPVQLDAATGQLTVSVAADKTVTPTATLNGTAVDLGVTLTNEDVDQLMVVAGQSSATPSISLKVDSLLTKVGAANDTFNDAATHILDNDGSYTVTLESDEIEFTMFGQVQDTVKFVVPVDDAFSYPQASNLISDGVQLVDYDADGTAMAATLQSTYNAETDTLTYDLTDTGLGLNRTNLNAVMDNDSGTTGEEPVLKFQFGEITGTQGDVNFTLAGTTDGGSAFTISFDLPMSVSDNSGVYTIATSESQTITPTATIGGAAVDLDGFTLSNADADQFIATGNAQNESPELALKIQSLLDQINGNSLIKDAADKLLANDGVYTLTVSAKDGDDVDSNPDLSFTMDGQAVSTVVVTLPVNDELDYPVAPMLVEEGVQLVDYDANGNANVTLLQESFADVDSDGDTDLVFDLTDTGVGINRDNLSNISDGDSGTTGTSPGLNVLLDSVVVDASIQVKQIANGFASEVATLDIDLDPSKTDFIFS